jgi:hypothetical protein
MSISSTFSKSSKLQSLLKSWDNLAANVFCDLQRMCEVLESSMYFSPPTISWRPWSCRWGPHSSSSCPSEWLTLPGTPVSSKSLIPYCNMMWALLRMATRGVTGPAIVSNLIEFLRTTEASDMLPLARTKAGQSSNLIFLRVLLDFLHSFGHSYPDPYPVLVPKLEIGLVVGLGVARTARG